MSKHLLITKFQTRAAAAARKGVPSTRQKYASRWHTLKTAIDKWHNESTAPNVREPTVAPLRSK